MAEQCTICSLCGRNLVAPFDKHHIVPKSKGGRQTVYLHKICHRKIHSLLSEAELKQVFNSIDKLKAHPEISKFIKWISNKPPSLYKRTRKKNYK